MVGELPVRVPLSIDAAAMGPRMPAEGKEFAAPDYENLLHALCGLYTREVAPVEAALKYAAVGTASYTAAEFGR